MPSKAILEQKQALVNDLADRLKSSVAGVIVNYSGISVADDTKLRKQLREAGVVYTVAKNTLIKRAAADAGVEIDDAVLNGTTAILAKTPSRETLLTQLAFGLNATIQGLAIAIKAIADKQSEGAEAPAAE